jgi:hypothetical protein
LNGSPPITQADRMMARGDSDRLGCRDSESPDPCRLSESRRAEAEEVAEELRGVGEHLPDLPDIYIYIYIYIYRERERERKRERKRERELRDVSEHLPDLPLRKRERE